MREAVYQRVENRQLAGVLAALVVGDQNAIERADWDVFRATGVAHLMSISGLHITMFAWLSSLLVAGLWRRSTRLTPRLCLALPASSAGALGGLLLAVLYALFSGWEAAAGIDRSGPFFTFFSPIAEPGGLEIQQKLFSLELIFPFDVPSPKRLLGVWAAEDFRTSNKAVDQGPRFVF